MDTCEIQVCHEWWLIIHRDGWHPVGLHIEHIYTVCNNVIKCSLLWQVKIISDIVYVAFSPLPLVVMGDFQLVYSVTTGSEIVLTV